MDTKEILNLKILNSDIGKEATILEYLKKLLIALFSEGESFSGKRPFGTSGWEYDVYKPLIRAGIIYGTLDEDGYVEECDEDAGQEKICDLIWSINCK